MSQQASFLASRLNAAMYNPEPDAENPFVESGNGDQRTVHVCKPTSQEIILVSIGLGVSIVLLFFTNMGRNLTTSFMDSVRSIFDF